MVIFQTQRLLIDGAAVLRAGNLEHEVPVAGNSDEAGTSSSIASGRSLSCQAKHLTRLVEEVVMVLFDNRRRCCHTLILNYFVSCGGMTSLIAKYRMAVSMLLTVLEQQRQEKGEIGTGECQWFYLFT